MILSTVNIKGGVGKSTIASHLAVWLKQNNVDVLLVDSDEQESSVDWALKVEKDLKVEKLEKSDDIYDEITAMKEKADVLIIDGAATLTETTRSILLASDLAIVPCTPSVLDLRATQKTFKVLLQAQKIRNGKPQALIVPNRVNKKYRLSKELLESIKDWGIKVTGSLGHRQAYADAAGQDSVVWRMGYEAREASKEITNLFKEIMSYAKEINE